MKFKNNLFSEKFKQIVLSADSVNDEVLLSSENLILTDKNIATRPGMRLSADPIVFDPWEFSAGYTEFDLTELYIDIDGKTARLAVSTEDDGYSNKNYHIQAIFSDTDRRDLGYIAFTRTDSYTFGVPSSYVIYSGKPTTGCGIYFLTRIVYGNAPDSVRIYELSEDMTNWLFLSDANCYIPTVLMNGHGNLIGNALINSELNISDPCKLEAFNMLNGRFRSYYTSDGYSNSFTLPALPNSESIKCSLRINPAVIAEWTIAANSNVSDTALIGEDSVRIRCNRKTGCIFFEYDNSFPYFPSFYGVENNLCITASKDCTESSLKVCSMSLMCNISANSSKATSSSTVFSGSDLYPAELIWIDPENPLYFPENCSLTFSEPLAPIKSIAALDGRLMIFKKQKLLSAKVTSPDRYDIDGILKNIENSGKVAFAAISADRQITLPSPICANTVKHMGDSVFFCCKNGTLYKTNSALSLILCSKTLSFEPSLAAVFDGKYLTFSDKDCYVFDPNTSNKLGLYHWSFPVSFIAALTAEGEAVFFARNDDGLIYCFTLDGDEDCYLTTDETPLKRKPIVSALTLELIRFGRRCRLYSLSVSADTEKPCEFELIYDGKAHQTVWLDKNRSLIHRPAVFRCLSAEFHFSGRAKLYGIGLKYAKLSKL